jgi:hypothetical protein
MSPDVAASLILGPVEPINGRDDVHPALTEDEVNAELAALFGEAEKGRAYLVAAARKFDGDTARALLVRQVIAVYATRLQADELRRWYDA